jgi:hypothetical protein
VCDHSPGDDVLLIPELVDGLIDLCGRARLKLEAVDEARDGADGDASPGGPLESK